MKSVMLNSKSLSTLPTKQEGAIWNGLWGSPRVLKSKHNKAKKGKQMLH